MNNNNIIAAGIAAVNEGLLKTAIAQAQGLVVQIDSLNKSNALMAQQNEEDAHQLRKLESMDLNYESVVGGTAPAVPNMNQTSIISAIEAENKLRQDDIKRKAAELTDRIAERMAAVSRNNAKIANVREQLAKLSVPEVKSSEILGA